MRSLLATCAVLLGASAVQAAVTLVDSTPLVPSGANGTGATLTLNSAYTVQQSGNNNVLVAIYTSRAFSTVATTTTGATFGGVAMTKAVELGQVEGTNFMQTASIYYLKQSDFGGSFTSAAQTFSITRATNNGGDYDDGYTVSFFTLAGVDQTSPVGVSGSVGQIGGTGAETNLAIDRTLTGLTSGSLILSAVSVAQGSPTTTITAANNIDTVLYNSVLGGNHRSSAGFTSVGGTSETFGYTYTTASNARSALVAVEFKAAIPEPGSFAAVAAGLVGVFVASRRRRAA